MKRPKFNRKGITKDGHFERPGRVWKSIADVGVGELFTLSQREEAGFPLISRKVGARIFVSNSDDSKDDVVEAIVRKKPFRQLYGGNGKHHEINIWTLIAMRI